MLLLNGVIIQLKRDNEWVKRWNNQHTNLEMYLLQIIKYAKIDPLDTQMKSYGLDLNQFKIINCFKMIFIQLNISNENSNI